jgi:hypothetical protein
VRVRRVDTFGADGPYRVLHADPLRVSDKTPPRDRLDHNQELRGSAGPRNIACRHGDPDRTCTPLGLYQTSTPEHNPG